MTTLYRKCSSALVHREIDDECVLLNRDTGQIHHLNPAASCIWRGMEDDMPIESIAEILVQTFLVDSATALTDARKFVDALSRLQLLERSEQQTKR